MRLSTRSKVGIPIVILTLVGAIVLSGLFLRNISTTHAANDPQPTATKGTLAQVTADTSPDASSSVSRGVRHMHTVSSQAAIQSSAVASSQVDSNNVGKLLKSFNGTSSLDSAVTNFGAEFEPPDQGLCVGNGYVIDAVNSAYNIYRTDGTHVAGPFNVNVLFHDGPKQFTSDPRCFYDKSTHTWFALILYISSNNQVGRFDLSVNPTGDPTTPWVTYKVNVTDLGNPGCPCFGDQPLLGIDQDNIYVSTNEFSILGPQYNGAQIYAISKPQLVALSQKVNFVQFSNLKIGGTVASSVQPAISFGSPDAEYFMNSLDPNGTFDNRIGVWAMTNRQAVSQGGVPTLSHVLITSETYGLPPVTVQKGSKGTLDSGDDRMQQVQYINGSLWGELTTAVAIRNDNAERAGAAWFEVHPSLNSDKLGGAKMVNQGYVTVKGNDLIYPAIQASADGTAAMVMTLSGSDYYPSAVYTVLHRGESSFGPVHIAAYGTGSYFSTSQPGRWGDYSFAILSPNDNSIWMATEYVPPKSSQTPDGKQNWGTRVLQVKATA